MSTCFIRSASLKVDNEDEEEHSVEGGVQVRLTSSDLQSTYLSQLASEDVKLIVPLDDNVLAPSNAEKILYNALEGLNDLDGGTLPLEDVLSDYEEDVKDDRNDDQEEYSSVVTSTKGVTSLLGLLMMSAASLVILLWLGIILHAWDFIRREVLSGHIFRGEWLPHITKDMNLRRSGGGNVGFKEKPLILGGVEEADQFVDDKVEVMSQSREKPAEHGVSSNGEEDYDVFEDASDADPDLLPLPGPIAAPSHSPTRRPLQMREIPSNPPLWSVRTFEPAPLSDVPLTPDPQHPLAMERVGPLAPRRTYRDLIPGFDLALILQMRPGFGLGADATWLVQFMVGVFGWFTILVSGGRREEDGTVFQR
jgi:hypothetical protein